MKKPDITEGKWHVGAKGPENMVYGERGEQVTAYNVMLPDGELAANARAIAALPDLLEALEQIEGDGHQAWEAGIARAALIKAGYTF